MHRRKFLVIGGLGLGTSGYLGWQWYNSPSVPDGMVADTLYLERNVFNARDVFAAREESYTLIEDEEIAVREFEDVDQVSSFSDETNFDESCIIVVQNGMRSESDLELDSIERIEGGLRVETSITQPLLPDHDDLITHSLLIRITDEKENAPEILDVNITGY